MNLIEYLLVLIAGLNIVLAHFIYYKNKTRLINKIWSLIALSVAYWALCLFLYFLVESSLLALIFLRASFFAPIMIASLIIPFNMLFPFGTGYNKRVVNYIIYADIVMLLVLVLTNSMVREVMTREGEILFSLGPLFYFYILYLAGLMFGSLFYIANTRKKTNTLIKAAVTKLIILIFIVSILVLTLVFILPLTGNVQFVWTGPLILTVLVGFMAATAAQQRLFDPGLALKNIVIYFLTIASIVLPFLLVCKAIVPEYHWAEFLYFAIAIPLFPALKRYFRHFTNKSIFHTYYNREVLAGLIKKLQATLETKEIYEIAGETIRKTFNTKTLAILVREKETIYHRVQYNTGFEVGDQMIFRGDAKLRKMFIESKRCIVSEYLNNDAFKEQQPLYQLLQKIGVVVIAPMAFKNGSNGLIPIGPKESGRQYNYEDLQLLADIGEQTALALDNALLHEEIKDLNKKLKTEVSMLTRNLREANERARVNSATEVEREYQDEQTEEEPKAKPPKPDGYYSNI